MIGSILSLTPDSFGATDDVFGDSGSGNLENDWNMSYTLKISMLPHSYIGLSLANKILFIGKAVMILQSKRNKAEDRIPQEELEAFSDAIMKMQRLEEINVVLLS
jgi:hypothetical protein